jgi:eukaryotic-like serine/threonine-protein kinase
MIAAHPDREPRPEHFEDDSEADFAATLPGEFRDSDDANAATGVEPDDERPLEALPTIGYVGRYALKYLLGAGGLGTVHAALDPLLSRPIAVKTLRLDVVQGQREALESQLLAEARAAAGLNHPYIVTVFDAGLSEQGVYIAMERLAGTDLRHLLADGWRPDPAQAARIVKRVADALGYAHGRGVIHCDVKPANIYMIGRLQPKVLDFGIARVAQQQILPEIMIDTAAGATAPPRDLGSPYYASPELLRGETLDARCDVYGAGVLLYELLTGRRAFDGDTLESIRHAVLHTDPPTVHAINPEVDQALSDIVARAMARNPAQRFRSARHLARALRRWVEADAGLPPPPPRVRSNWRWRVFAGLGLAAAAVFGVLATRHGPSASAPAPAPTVAAAAAHAAPPDPATAPQESVAGAETAPQEPAPVAADRHDTPRQRAAERHAAREAAAQARRGAAAAPAPQGVVRLAVSPWGQVEVDGVAAGTTPPLSSLTLPAGRHRIVVRNGDFPPLATTVVIGADKPLTLRHRFGA